ncbi:MAG: 2'-5' RNA ligase family protein [Clostridiaceae bacterium]
MKYYLVALFDDESTKTIEATQKSLSKKYRLYKNLPTLHITLDIVEDPDLNKLDQVLTKIVKPYSRFKIELTDTMLFDESRKALTLKVVSKGYIKRLARSINDTLKLHGFNVKPAPESPELQLSLLSANHPPREWNKIDPSKGHSIAKKDAFFRMPKISRIELWKSTSSKKEMVVKSYPLRYF